MSTRAGRLTGRGRWSIVILGVFLVAKRALRMMAPQCSGSIVVTGPLGCERGPPATVAYHAAKHAVLGSVRTAAVECGGTGVRVNAVVPGIIDTPLMQGLVGTATGGDPTPLRRTRSPPVACLASDAASFVNGAAWTVDGGALAMVGSGFQERPGQTGAGDTTARDITAHSRVWPSSADLLGRVVSPQRPGEPSV